MLDQRLREVAAVDWRGLASALSEVAGLTRQALDVSGGASALGQGIYASTSGSVEDTLEGLKVSVPNYLKYFE